MEAKINAAVEMEIQGEIMNRQENCVAADAYFDRADALLAEAGIENVDAFRASDRFHNAVQAGLDKLVRGR